MSRGPLHVIEVWKFWSYFDQLYWRIISTNWSVHFKYRVLKCYAGKCWHRTQGSRRAEMVWSDALLYCWNFFKGIYYFPNDFLKITSSGCTEEVWYQPANPPQQCSWVSQRVKLWDHTAERPKQRPENQPTVNSQTHASVSATIFRDQPHEKKGNVKWNFQVHSLGPDINALVFHPVSISI